MYHRTSRAASFASVLCVLTLAAPFGQAQPDGPAPAEIDYVYAGDMVATGEIAASCFGGGYEFLPDQPGTWFAYAGGGRIRFQEVWVNSTHVGSAVVDALPDFRQWSLALPGGPVSVEWPGHGLATGFTHDIYSRGPSEPFTFSMEGSQLSVSAGRRTLPSPVDFWVQEGARPAQLRHPYFSAGREVASDGAITATGAWTLYLREATIRLGDGSTFAPGP